MAVEKILVVGMGLMGRGIAQVCAQAGIDTYAYDISKEAAEKAIKAVDKDLSKRVEKGKMSAEDKDAVLKHIIVVDSLEQAKDVDIVEEAVFEDLEIKKNQVHRSQLPLRL